MMTHINNIGKASKKKQASKMMGECRQYCWIIGSTDAHKYALSGEWKYEQNKEGDEHGKFFVISVHAYVMQTVPQCSIKFKRVPNIKN